MSYPYLHYGLYPPSNDAPRFFFFFFFLQDYISFIFNADRMKNHTITCAPRRLGSACASHTQTVRSLRCPHEEVVFGRTLDRPWLPPSGTAEDTLWFNRIKLPVCAAFCSGTDLRSRNSQTCTTRFRISELGNLVQMFSHFRYGVSVRLTNHSYWDSCLRWFMAVKKKCSFESRLPEDWES